MGRNEPGGDAFDPRVPALLRGEERFTADVECADALHVVFVRSHVAAGAIRTIDTSAARGAAGVVAVFTARDLAIPDIWEIAIIDERFAQPVLARDRVRHVGERIVAVVAETLAAATDAAELVVVDVEPGPTVASIDAALADDAPVLFDHAPGNVCLDWPSDRPDHDFSSAVHHVTVAHEIPRLSVAPLECHSVLALPRPDGIDVVLSTQVPNSAQRQIARSLGLPIGAVRIRTPAVGGGFGGKAAGGLPDQIATAAIARRLDRPVRFVEQRGDNLVGMQGRGVRNRVTMHADTDGRVVGITASIECDAGGYPSVGAVEPGKTRLLLSGPYALDAVDVVARAVVTDLPPVGAYRGPGRAEASLMLERTMDVLARDIGMDPIEIRRCNLVPADAFPFTTATGIDYDSGDYARLLDVIEARGELDRWRRRRDEQRADEGPLLGIGVALAVDSTAWFARIERSTVTITDDGRVEVATGSTASGQRHERLLRSIVVDTLPVEAASVDVVEGDTAAVDSIDGSMGSRSTQMAGGSVLRSCQLLDDRLRDAAASILECSVDDVVRNGTIGYSVRGVPARTLAIGEISATLPRGERASQCVHEQPAATYPSTAHLSIVEIDRDTGRVTPVHHLAVTDCGTVLDHASATGQVVGATVQGIAQALLEQSVFDEDGMPRTTTLADYAIPSAVEVPPIDTVFVESSSPRNPMGAKGVGEIGMLAAPVAVLNAVVDALDPFSVRHLDMPCTPEKVWRAMRAG